MKLTRNEIYDILELREHLIENKFPQSFIDLVDEYLITNILTIDND